MPWCAFCSTKCRAHQLIPSAERDELELGARWAANARHGAAAMMPASLDKQGLLPLKEKKRGNPRFADRTHEKPSFF